MNALPPQLLVLAYRQGVFPMGHGREIRWYSPDPRAILPLETFHASKTLRQLHRGGRFTIRIDTAFRDVMTACADRREGTWITPAIITAYCALHTRGLAHSVEAWQGENLVGGLYGVAIGGAFFGESMFHLARDASKVALLALVERMTSRGFSLLDTQFITPHLKQFGAVEIPRDEYLRRLESAIEQPCRFGD